VIERSFDLLAPHYRWMECVLAGRKLQDCRTRFLNEFSSARNVLLLGEGNGRFLCELLKCNPAARVTCVDASRRMQSAARRRLDRVGLSGAQVTFIHSDVLTCKLAADSYDAIATHFFLDCFPSEQLDRIVQRVSSWAAPGARWVISDFRAPDAGLGRQRAEIILAMMYLFFRVATRLPARKLTDPRAYLERNRFVLMKQAVREWGLLYSELWRKAEA
jgi:ubiquinone/menaquinone biosynthesis C-methylase UbiE